MSDRLNDDLISAYLDNELSSDERSRVESWLAEDLQARQLCDELRALKGTLGGLPRATPRAGFRERVLQSIVQEAAASTAAHRSGTAAAMDGPSPAVRTRDPEPAASDWRRWFWPLAAVAAAVIASLLLPGDEGATPTVATGDAPTAAGEAEHRPEPGPIAPQIGPRPPPAAGGLAKSQDGAPAAAAGSVPESKRTERGPTLETQQPDLAIASEPAPPLPAAPSAPGGGFGGLGGDDRARPLPPVAESGSPLAPSSLREQPSLESSDDELLVVYIESAPEADGNRDRAGALVEALAARGIELHSPDAQSDLGLAQARRALQQIERERQAAPAAAGGNPENASAKRMDDQVPQARAQRDQNESVELVMVELPPREATALLHDLQLRGLMAQASDEQRRRALRQDKAAAAGAERSDQSADPARVLPQATIAPATPPAPGATELDLREKDGRSGAGLPDANSAADAPATGKTKAWRWVDRLPATDHLADRKQASPGELRAIATPAVDRGEAKAAGPASAVPSIAGGAGSPVPRASVPRAAGEPMGPEPQSSPAFQPAPAVGLAPLPPAAPLVAEAPPIDLGPPLDAASASQFLKESNQRTLGRAAPTGSRPVRILFVLPVPPKAP